MQIFGDHKTDQQSSEADYRRGELSHNHKLMCQSLSARGAGGIKSRHQGAENPPAADLVG